MPQSRAGYSQVDLVLVGVMKGRVLISSSGIDLLGL